MNRYPYFPLWVNDLANDEHVQAMDTLAFGAYALLLLRAWHQLPVGTLPDDDKLLAKWSGLADIEWAAVSPAVKRCFKVRDGRLHQKRMKVEYDRIVSDARERENKAKAAARARWGEPRNNKELRCSSNAHALQEKEPSNAIHSHIQNHSQKINTHSDSGEPEIQASPPAGSILTFECVGSGSKSWGLTQEFIDSLHEQFPGVDVLLESKKARGWCQTNPTKRKTPGGMPRFLRGWMERVQNSSRPILSNRSSSVVADADAYQAMKEKANA